MNGQQIAQRAREQLSALTGIKADTVSALAKDEQGWHVTVEMVEMRRIPDSSDMLASYEALLDAEGNVLSYKRTRRYRRDEAMAQET
jgi:hypothetical protein